MRFKLWLTIAEGRRELATTYRGLLQDVPQDPVHHPEGNVLTHVQLVRKAIPRAVMELNKLKAVPPFSDILSDIDFTISSEEAEILALSAWLHDIGKASATTVHPQTGKIQSIGHESPEHYSPQIEKLKEIAPPETVALYTKNMGLINFLIEHHMDFMSKEGFPASFLRTYFQNGKAKNSPEMKLLLILMWSDKMGRKPEETIAASIAKNADRLAASSARNFKKDFNIANQTKPYQGGPADFNALLMQRGLTDPGQRLKALKNKFPGLSNQEIEDIFR